MRTHTRMRFTREFLGLLAACTILGQQSQFQGSVATGTVSPTPLALTLHDTIDRGLKTNLGLLVSDSTNESVRGQKLRSLSALLPQLNGQAGETIEQLNALPASARLFVQGYLYARPEAPKAELPTHLTTDP